MKKENAKTVRFDGSDAGPVLPFDAPGGTRETVGEADCLALTPTGAAPVTLGTILFRYGSSLRLAVLAKAAFSMRTSPMNPVKAPPIYAQDAHHRGNASERVLVSNDLIPGRTRVDVTLDGHARTAFATSLTTMTARLKLEQHGVVAIDKALRIVGDGGQPFTAMPIGYEFAARGHGSYATPIGVDDDGRANVQDPTNATRAAGFGPFAESWPVRRDLLSPTQREHLRAPVMALGNDFDWRYFQAAPPDQQLDGLAPNAKLTIAGFHAATPSITAELPNALAKGAIFGLDEREPDRARELWFRADSVHIHADRAECVVCWRAVVEVPSEAVVRSLLVTAGVETAQGQIVLPTTPPRPAREPSAPMRITVVGGPSGSGTAAITDEMMAAALAPLPFVDESAPTAPPPWITAPTSEEAVSTPTPAPPSEPARILAAPTSGPVVSDAPATPPRTPSEPARISEAPISRPVVSDPPATPPQKPALLEAQAPPTESAAVESRPPERVIQVSNATEPKPKPAKPKPKRRKRVRRVSEGVDLNEILYGKKS